MIGWVISWLKIRVLMLEFFFFFIVSCVFLINKLNGTRCLFLSLWCSLNTHINIWVFLEKYLYSQKWYQFNSKSEATSVQHSSHFKRLVWQSGDLTVNVLGKLWFADGGRTSVKQAQFRLTCAGSIFQVLGERVSHILQVLVFPEAQKTAKQTAIFATWHW